MGLEMVRLAERTYYFPGGTNVGLYRGDGSVAYLIDSGNDSETGRRLLSSLSAAGMELKAILNTHSNADHCGGNSFLQEKTSCAVMAPPVEAAFLEHPYLEPAVLYGGMPPPELMGKFFVAKPSRAEKDGLSSLPQGITAVALPGHYFGMQGYITSDGILFAADSLFSRQVIEKYHIVFLYDVAAFLDTLLLLPALGCKLYVPSHAEPTADVEDLAEVNRNKVLEVADLVLGACESPSSPDEILKHIYDHYGLQLDMGQYALAGSTIRSYTTYLYNLGKLKRTFEGNRLRFITV